MTTAEVEVGDAAQIGMVSHAPAGSASGMGYMSLDGQPMAAEYVARSRKGSLLFPGIIGIFALAAVGFGLHIFMGKTTLNNANTFQQLGAGISNSTGIRGYLQVRWQDNKAQYQVKMESIDPVENPGFSYLVANPPGPMSINLRVLDITGFALCSKQVNFQATGAKASGDDNFQNILDQDGKVTSTYAQGILPCTADQFRQASYWDFSTDFPTLDKQDALVKKSGIGKARPESDARAPQRRAAVRNVTLFTTEGDDRATSYDTSRNVLGAGLRNFLVTRTGDRTFAENWAGNESLFHYRCDQHGRCTLTHAGGAETILVQVLQ